MENNNKDIDIKQEKMTNEQAEFILAKIEEHLESFVILGYDHIGEAVTICRANSFQHDMALKGLIESFLQGMQ